jgi:hypothetical protein
VLQLRFFSFFLLADRHAASCALLLLWQVQLLKEKKAKADEELTGTPRTKESVAAEGWLKDLGVWELAVEKWPNMSRHKRPLSAPPDPLNLGGSRVAQLRRAHAGESHVRDAGAGSPPPSLVTEGGAATHGGRPLGVPAGTTSEEAASHPTASAAAPQNAGAAMMARIDAGMARVDEMAGTISTLTTAVQSTNSQLSSLMQIVLAKMGQQNAGSSSGA